MGLMGMGKVGEIRKNVTIVLVGGGIRCDRLTCLKREEKRHMVVEKRRGEGGNITEDANKAMSRHSSEGNKTGNKIMKNKAKKAVLGNGRRMKRC